MVTPEATLMLGDIVGQFQVPDEFFVDNFFQ